MSLYTIAFVDSITATPTVRLNLDGGDWAVQADTTDFSPPSLRRAVVSTLLTDGQLIPAAAYDNRVVTLRLRCTATTDDLAAAAVQNLARELDRPRNILMYRPGTSQPVFFRTLRADFNSIQWDPLTKFATVHIPAEPFGYGPQEVLSAVTVNNDPAAGSNGMYFDVAAVKGDVETPLFATLVGSLSTGNHGTRKSVLSIRRRTNATLTPLVLQAEAMTVSTDTSLQANDAAMSGAGQNFVRVSFATNANLTVRLQMASWPALTGLQLRGSYRVYARVRHTTATDTFSMRLWWGDGDITTTYINDTAVVPQDLTASAPTCFFVDLGSIQIPAGFDPVADFAGVEMTPANIYLRVDAGRTAGTGTLDIDYLLIMPNDDRTLMIRWPGESSPTTWVLDGSRTAVYGRNAGGEIAPTQPIPLDGDVPLLSPGVTNRLFFARDLSTAESGDLGDSITATTSITPYYYPRYLYVRPVAS